MTPNTKIIHVRDSFICDWTNGTRQRDSFICDWTNGTRQRDSFICDWTNGTRQRDSFICDMPNNASLIDVQMSHSGVNESCGAQDDTTHPSESV